MPIRYQKYSVVADTGVCWLLQSYKQNPIQEGREGFECFPLSLVLQFVDVRKQISELISFIIFSRLLYSEANEKSQTKWPLQGAGTFTYICICTHRHVGQILQTLKTVFFPHYQCNGDCEQLSQLLAHQPVQIWQSLSWFAATAGTAMALPFQSPCEKHTV